jgi:serine/threonine protein kinase
VDDYLQKWEECKDLGEQVSPTDLCPNWPEGQSELARLIALLEACDRLLDVEETLLAGPDRGTSPACIGGYEVLGELGRGGMGVVYRVWDSVLRREAALKVLRPAGPQPPTEADRLARRFQQEAQVLAQLKHEHIVPVFEAQVDNGQPYFVMECVPGGNLAMRMSEMTVAGPKVIVPLLEKVARAVHYAHSQGVLHRDLKPANILLAGQACPLDANNLGRLESLICFPKVTDFGLAKLLGAAVDLEADTAVINNAPTEAQAPIPDVSRLTAPGFQPGTPAYMAPEQFDPAFGAVSPATDVWALGVILFELLTGQKPFVGDTREQLRARVCHGRTSWPASQRRFRDRRLEAVVRRCLEKDPAQRFASAAELADRLAPRRSLRRRVSVILAGLAVAAAGTWWAIWESTPERRYERSVAPLLARLQKGEEVTLIEPGGKAPAFQVRCGEGHTKARMTEDGFVVRTPALGLVEFLPRVPVPRYRLYAEFQHDKSDFGPVGDSGVGVTFTGRHVPSPDGMQHVVGAVAVDDWYTRIVLGKNATTAWHLASALGQAASLPNLWQPAWVAQTTIPNGGGNGQCCARLQLVWFLDTPVDGRAPFKHHLSYPAHESVLYPAPTGRVGVLHSLVIDVDPERRTAVLGHSPDQIMGPLRTELFRRFSKRLREAHKEVQGVDLDPLNQPTIGMLVSGGQCTLRRLRIVPQHDSSD